METADGCVEQMKPGPFMCGEVTFMHVEKATATVWLRESTPYITWRREE